MLMNEPLVQRLHWRRDFSSSLVSCLLFFSLLLCCFAVGFRIIAKVSSVGGASPFRGRRRPSWVAGWLIELLVLNRRSNRCLAHSLCKMGLMMMLPGVPLTKLLCRTNEIFFYPFYQIMSLRTYKTSAIPHCIGVKSTSLP